MEINLITTIIIVALSILITSIVVFLYSKMKKSSYDKDNNKVILESIRSSLEQQMYGLNDRLIQSEERWKDVNHLLIKNEYSEKKFPSNNENEIHYSNFLKENGIEQNDLIIDNKLIFIITPFHDKYYEDYKVIRDVCTQNGFKAYRGDETYFKSDIFPEMLKLIVKSSLIIANINGRNSNVLYELGIAQALDKPVLLISKEPNNLPIDIKSKRFLIYSSYADLQEKIRAELFNLTK